MAVIDGVDSALVSARELPPMEYAKALRSIAKLLPPEHPRKQEFVQESLAILGEIEPTPVVIAEKMRTWADLLLHVEEIEQKELFALLDSMMMDNQPTDPRSPLASAQSYVVRTVLDIDPTWAKNKLLEANWTLIFSIWRDVIRAVAKQDYVEALQLLKEIVSNYAGRSNAYVDVIEIVAQADLHLADELIQKYAEQINDKRSDAYIVLVEGYVAAGQLEKAIELYETEVAPASHPQGGHIPDQLQLAVIERASCFLSIEQIQELLIHFQSPAYRHNREKEQAQKILIHMAVQQGRLDLLENRNWEDGAEIAAVLFLAQHYGIDAANDYCHRHHVAPSREQQEWFEAQLASWEAVQNSAKLKVLLQHFKGKSGGPHPFCEYMLVLPVTLQRLLEAQRISTTEVMGLIEDLFESLLSFDCSTAVRSLPHDHLFEQVRCQNRKTTLIAETSWFSLFHRAKRWHTPP